MNASQALTIVMMASEPCVQTLLDRIHVHVNLAILALVINVQVSHYLKIHTIPSIHSLATSSTHCTGLDCTA